MKYGWLVALIFWGCGHKSESGLTQAEEMVAKAIAQSGGLEKWKSIDTLTFTKKSILYLEDGAVESETLQDQKFIFDPYLQVVLNWKNQGKSIFYDGSKTCVFEDEIQSSCEEGMSAAIASAYYVISKPFDLLDQKERLQAEERHRVGKDSLQVVKVDYSMLEDEGDVWWFYFKDDHQFWGSRVYHSPTYALIENSRMDTTTGLVLPAYRRSFRVDESNTVQYLRAEFWYTDYQLD